MTIDTQEALRMSHSTNAAALRLLDRLRHYAGNEDTVDWEGFDRVEAELRELLSHEGFAAVTVNTKEALRLLEDAYFDGSRRAYDKLRALLSAKQGEPSAANWRQAIVDYCTPAIGDLPTRSADWIEQRAIALRDAEKEKGNG